VRKEDLAARYGGEEFALILGIRGWNKGSDQIKKLKLIYIWTKTPAKSA
jgi:GGDEF domain-containing protein